MRPVDRLLEAKTELEFFVILSNSLFENYKRGFHPGLKPVPDKERSALRVQIRQVFAVPNDQGGRTAKEAYTHVFTLYQDGTLIWEMPDQPPIVGLKAIQDTLRRVRNPFEQPGLPRQAAS